MINNSNHQEIEREQAYVTSLYARLDRAKTRSAEQLDRAHLGPTTETDQAASERESFARLYSGRSSQLSTVERGLCFGRIDGIDRSHFYIGRIGLFDDEYEPLLIDWRAPVAQSFYRATAAAPLGVQRRRHIRLDGRRVVGVDDDLLDSTGLDDQARRSLTGEAALLASVSADRTGRMGEIVATIQAEQDQIVRSGLPGILVVQGGPGTGKTVVALHRAAYLLYSHREQLSRRGVLVVGPNSTFLRYIDQVLPSLGETDVVLSTVGDLYPGLSATADEAPAARRLKGDLLMAEVIARAVRLLRRDGVRQDLAPERLLSRLWAWPEFLEAVAPELDATERAALRRDPGAAWTPADVALLDEAAELVGDSEATVRERRRAKAAKASAEADHLEYTRGVVLSELASDRITLEPWEIEDFIGVMADRTRPRDEVTSTIAERAAADRTWQFGHVIVDEAQELSPMDWRMLMRRCPRRSMTLVGDLAQAGTETGVRSWAELLDGYAAGRWRTAELTVNYRTPSEIMAVAGDVLAAVDPELRPPTSVRSTGVRPLSRCVREADLVDAVAAAITAERERLGDGRLAVIVPRSRYRELAVSLGERVPGLAHGTGSEVLDAAAAVLDVDQVKGLEFDSVLIADPGTILRDSPRGRSDLYVAVTRATRRLGVITAGVLPTELQRLGSAAGEAGGDDAGGRG
ncbi:HelD family protein [Microlunatus speluncae]|uniref:HelD family protein n=1 Tax=Microlunatus speluncae TaxID=2594267 RepID=UPI0012663493|nr:AAA family ATPase [Microlunatus speluncae]